MVNRSIFMAGAFVVAIGGAIATKADSAITPITRYYAPIGQLSPCNSVTCDTQGSIDCVDYTQFNTYQSKNGTSCITLVSNLKKNP